MKQQSKTIVWGVSLLLLVVGILLLSHHLKMRQPLWLQGEMVCNSYRAASKIAGRIEWMGVSEGDWVDSGALLYRLSTPELRAKREQAEAAYTAAAAMDRQAVTGARLQQREAAYNLWQRALAALTYAEKSFQRAERLYAQGVISTQRMDEARAQYEAAKGAEGAARAEYSLVQAGADREELEAAAARVKGSEGALSEVDSLLGSAEVRAPISGEVSTIVARTGELVPMGFPAVTLLDRAEQWASFNIRESLLSLFSIGRNVRGYIPALKLEAIFKVYYLSPEASYATWSASRSEGEFDLRTFEVRARPVEPIKGLRPGMSVLVNQKEIE